MLHDLLENMAQWHSLDTSYNYQSFPPRPSDPFLNTFQRLYQTPYLISNWLSLITCFKESSLAKDLYWLQKFLLGCWNSAMREYSNVNNLSSVQLWMNGQKKKKKKPNLMTNSKHINQLLLNCIRQVLQSFQNVLFSSLWHKAKTI